MFTRCAESEPDCGLSAIQVEVSQVTGAVCGQPDGAIVLDVQSALQDLSNFEYSIDGGMTFQSQLIFDGIVPDLYTLVVRDVNAACEEMVSQVVVPSGISFDLEVMPIIQTYCSVAQDPQGFGCHVPDGRANTDFLQFDVIQANALEIKNRVLTRNMPRSNSGLTLTTEQIETIVCWVNDGALNN